MNAIIKFKNEFLWPLADRLSPFRYHLIAIGIALALGAVVGGIKASLAPSKLATIDAWAMPQWAPFQSEPIVGALADATIFTVDPSKRKPDAAAVAVVPVWRFMGTMRKGNQEIALIEVDKGQRVRRILPGDELPGGGKVTAVRIGELVFADTAGEQTLRLYPDDKVSADAVPKNR